MKKIVLLFITVQALFANSDYIELYNAYTNGAELVVQGRVIDQEDKKTKESKILSAFFNSEKKEVNVYLKIDKENFSLKSDNEGYFTFEVTSKVGIELNNTVVLHTDGNGSENEIVPFFPSTKKHIGVISDFDDTVVVSNVTNKGKLLYNSFFKNFKERELVKDISRRIKSRLKNNSALFFISGSPHQFSNSINNFLDYHHFPKRAILTKKIHGEKSDSLHASIAYKYAKIVKLIKMYPHVKWILYGDSGEKDEEIYWKVKQDYSEKIEAIYIRNVESEKVKKLHEELKKISAPKKER